jgi:hypothetical protein
MPEISWQAAADGRYWIDVVLGNVELLVMIDLGLVDPFGWVGFELEPATYQRLKQSGLISSFWRRARRDASGRLSWSESGLGNAQLFDPRTRQGIGPRVRLFSSCGMPGVPNRVGIVFFHCLAGCHVHWELDKRIWRIEYP